jgi:hypothetical protein
MVFAIIDLIGNLFIEECRKEQKDKRFSCLFRDMAIQILWSVASKDLESPHNYLKAKYKSTNFI